MGTKAAVGRSLKLNSRRAAQEAARQALDDMGGAGADVALVFATSGHNQCTILEGIRETLGEGVRVVGCSGEGIITQSGSDERDRAVAIMLITSDKISFEPFLFEGYASDSVGCAHRLADHLGSRPTDDLIGVLLLPDGLVGNCSALLETLDERLDTEVVLVGGTSADAMQMEQTWQYLDNEARSGCLAGLVLRGQGRLEVAVSHGCTPVGLQHSITRMEEGWVHEIDGRPAWSVFKEYLDGDPQDLNAEGIVRLCVGRPLDKKSADEYSPFVIRTPLGLDKDSQALFFPGGGLCAGEPIRLTRRDPDHIQKSAKACAEGIMARGGGRPPSLLFQFDCAGRGQVLFGMGASRAIVQPLQEALGQEIPWLGFHTYGEIAPISGKSFYHNYTVVLCAIYDDDDDEAVQAA